MPEIDTAITSLVALVVATASMLISYRLFQLQHDPEVVVYATPDEKRPSVVILVIENIGSSVVLDVKFSSSAPVSEKAFGFENAWVPVTSFWKIKVAASHAGTETQHSWGDEGDTNRANCDG